MARIVRNSPIFSSAGRSTGWESWANIVLAVWFFISPWALGFGHVGSSVFGRGNVGGAVGTTGATGTAGAAAWNAWILSILVFLVAISAMGRISFRQEWLNVLFGIWIFVAPWVLGFTRLMAAAWDHWIVGGLIFFVSLSAVSGGRLAEGDRSIPPPPAY